MVNKTAKMKIDESKMKEFVEPSILSRLRNSIISLIFGMFFLYITRFIFILLLISKEMFNYSLVLIAMIFLCFGWFYGEEFTWYMYGKVLNKWDPRNMFR